MPPMKWMRQHGAQSGTESGFKFIKDDTFQVDSVFLKTPERINALMAIMTLCLMVYGVTQYELRQSLQEKGETVLNQAKKPTDKPSLKWIYFLFRVVNEFKICIDGKIYCSSRSGEFTVVDASPEFKIRGVTVSNDYA